MKTRDEGGRQREKEREKERGRGRKRKRGRERGRERERAREILIGRLFEELLYVPLPTYLFFTYL